MYTRLMIRSVGMEKLTLESKRFRKVMQNLRLENMSLSEKGQKKILELVNMNTTITPEFIKDLLKYGEIQ